MHIGHMAAFCSLMAWSSAVAVGGPSLRWNRLPDLPGPSSGQFVGSVADALIVAGGSNFPVSLFEGGTKVWLDTIHVYEAGNDAWATVGRLEHALAYGASVSTTEGLICVGGSDGERHYADAFILRHAQGKIERRELPDLAGPLAFHAGALVGDTVLICGGQDSPPATRASAALWALDMKSPRTGWRSLPPCPGPGRILPVAASSQGAFYVFGGCALSANAEGKAQREYLTDAYRYTPGEGWERLADLPHPVTAAPSPAIALPEGQILVLGGDDGSLVDRVAELKDTHPGFRHDILAYDISADAWSAAGHLPAALVTTAVAPWQGGYVIAGGEDRPGHRQPIALLAKPAAKPLEGEPVDDTRTAFVEGGAPAMVRQEGKTWTRGDGYIQCDGLHNILWAGRRIGEGDFHLSARLTILDLAGSAASFVIDGNNHFGFEGATGQVFTSGSLFGGGTKFWGAPSRFVSAGVPFTFEVVREGEQVHLFIDGKLAHETTDKRKAFGMVGFRPWRSTMRINEFCVVGQTLDPLPARTQPVTYSIPTIDLSDDTQRQVIVERIPGQYLGHPTTVLLKDNRTILCTYPLGHGGPAAVLKKSTDGGLTWSERLPVPENWSTATNCPCIHRLTDSEGVERLFVFEGVGQMRQSVSQDEGLTWTPFEPNGLRCIVAPITILPIAKGRHLAVYHRGAGDRDRSPLTIWQSISEDGGLTWGAERLVGEFEGADPCEPALIRSPDGRQVACICRENRRRYNSLLMVSDDEGETWSDLVEVPAGLTGDRHLARYAPDGRLVMTFRDTAQGSPTRGDFVAWVGTYEDVVNLREGQCRVHLINSPRKFDLGYPGLELLPDGTFVATTYAVLAEGEKNCVVSVRFKLSEIDERLGK